MSNPDTSVTLMARRDPARAVTLPSPVCIAPFAGACNAHPDGELAIAAAAAASGSLFVVPHYAGFPLEQVVDAARKGEAAVAGARHAARPAAGAPVSAMAVETAGAPLWFQLYPQGPQHAAEGMDRAYARGALRHVSSLGCTAVVVTVDCANNGNREKTYASATWVASVLEECGGFAKPRALDGACLGPLGGHSSSLTWADIAWLRGACDDLGLGLVLKGIMTAEDAVLAVGAGVDGVVVSNHGGRQLDGTDGTIECLAECVAAVAGRADVYLDGGVRRGRDVFKAIALGATAVFVGRPVLWGLSLAGEQGVAHALAILRRELLTVCQLAGCRGPADITRAHVRDRWGASKL